MNIKRKLLIAGAVAVVVIVVLIGGIFAAISGDWSSLGATGSETLAPSGASVGQARACVR